MKTYSKPELDIIKIKASDIYTSDSEFDLPEDELSDLLD